MCIHSIYEGDLRSMRNDNKKKVLFGLLGVLLIIMAAVLFLWSSTQKKQEREEVTPTPVVTPEVTPEITEEPVITEEPQATARPELQDYVSMNSDVIGYIYIPDTKIQYPVLIGEDNEYYLNHDVNKKSSKSASIYVDYKYKDTDIREEFLRHTLIYGHNMNNRTMFSQVVEYQNLSFLEEHPYIYYENLQEQGRWRVFSVYELDADQETIKRKFPEDEEYVEYLTKIKERSIHPVEVNLTKDSKIITLSTCSDNLVNGRIIVHAVLE